MQCVRCRRKRRYYNCINPFPALSQGEHSPVMYTALKSIAFAVDTSIGFLGFWMEYSTLSQTLWIPRTYQCHNVYAQPRLTRHLTIDVTVLSISTCGPSSYCREAATLHRFLALSVRVNSIVRPSIVLLSDTQESRISSHRLSSSTMSLHPLGLS